MNLLERFKSWATSWWYVPTIEARQAVMLHRVWNVYRWHFGFRNKILDRELGHNAWARLAARFEPRVTQFVISTSKDFK